MRSLKTFSLPLVMVFALVLVTSAQDSGPAPGGDTPTAATVVQLPASTSPSTPASFDQVLDRIVEREHFFVAQMRHAHPLVETYIQNMKSDKELGAVPTNDHYFLGRLDMSNGTDDHSFIGQAGFG